MKKSTILIVVLVYIISFVVVGFFGIKLRVYDPTTYVTNIEVFEPTGDKSVVTKNNENYDYTFRVSMSEETKDMTLQVRTTPVENSFPEVYFKNNDVDQFELNTTYDITESASCKFEIEGSSYFIRIHFHDVLAYDIVTLSAIAENGGNYITKDIMIGCWKQ